MPAEAQHLRDLVRLRLSVVDITIHSSFLPQNDPDAALAFYRDVLGFEVCNDVGYKGMRWITTDRTGSATAPSAILRATTSASRG